MADRSLAASARFYRRIVGARIRSDWQYRTSFVSLLVSQAAASGTELLALVFAVRLVPGLGGWSGGEVLFLYGAAMVPFGLSDLFVSMVEDLPFRVQSGNFDRVLLRPVSPLLQLCADGFELRRVGKLIPAVVVLVATVPRLGLDWDLVLAARLVLMIAVGTVIYSALWVLTASLSFWVVDVRSVANAFTYGGAMSTQYPMHIYHRWIRVVLGWVVPLGFVAYVPGLFLLDTANPLGLPTWTGWLPVPVAVALCGVTRMVWCSGITHYQSTGS